MHGMEKCSKKQEQLAVNTEKREIIRTQRKVFIAYCTELFIYRLIKYAYLHGNCGANTSTAASINYMFTNSPMETIAFSSILYA